jgi:hypothetical protein
VDDSKVALLSNSLLHLCIIVDQRRWSDKGAYGDRSGGEIQSFRGFCSRRSKSKQNLVKQGELTSLKCDCKASFTLDRAGNLSFKNDHFERCLVIVRLYDDGYVL